MEKMTKDEMITFLRGMRERKQYLKDEKARLMGCVESLEEAIKRNSFARREDNSDVTGGGSSPDKVLRILLNSQRDIEEETRNLVLLLRDIYEAEDQIGFVERCMLRLNGKDQFLLHEAYVMDSAVESLCDKLNMSRSNVYRRMSLSLSCLLSVYNAGCEIENNHKAERLMREVSAFLPEGMPA